MVYRDEAGHFTNKENDGGPCKHKRIHHGKYQVSENGIDYRDVKKDEYDKYEADEDEFDATTDKDFELEKETQEALDKTDYVINEKGQAVPRKYNEKYGNKPDSTTYSGAEVIGGNNDNEGMLKDKTSLSEKESNNLDPNNPKYKGFSRSHITNAKLVDEGETFTDSNGNERKVQIIEYIPYGALQDGDNKKLYGIVDNYDGSDSPDIGAIVSPSLESAKEQLEDQVKLSIQGSDRYVGKGQYDKDWYDMLKDPQYEFDDETKKKYSQKYGWDFNKPWEEHDFIKNDPYKAWSEGRIGRKKGKIGSRELSLDELADKVSGLEDKELARDILAINAANFGLSEKEVLDYYDKKKVNNGSQPMRIQQASYSMNPNENYEPAKHRLTPNEQKREFAMKQFAADMKKGNIYDMRNPMNGSVSNTYEILDLTDDSVTYKDKNGNTKTTPKKEFASIAVGGVLRK